MLDEFSIYFNQSYNCAKILYNNLNNRNFSFKTLLKIFDK